MGIKFPKIQFAKKPKRVSYYFYRPLTRKWNRSPSVQIYGLDGTVVTISFNRGRLTVENDTHVLTTEEIKISDPTELFSGFNNLLGDAYQDGIVRGPVNGGPVYLELQRRWTISDDTCRSFLEDVWHSLSGQKLTFSI